MKTGLLGSARPTEYFFLQDAGLAGRLSRLAPLSDFTDNLNIGV